MGKNRAKKFVLLHVPEMNVIRIIRRRDFRCRTSASTYRPNGRQTFRRKSRQSAVLSSSWKASCSGQVRVGRSVGRSMRLPCCTREIQLLFTFSCNNTRNSWMAKQHTPLWKMERGRVPRKGAFQSQNSDEASASPKLTRKYPNEPTTMKMHRLLLALINASPVLSRVQILVRTHPTIIHTGGNICSAPQSIGARCTSSTFSIKRWEKK